MGNFDGLSMTFIPTRLWIWPRKFAEAHSHHRYKRAIRLRGSYHSYIQEVVSKHRYFLRLKMDSSVMVNLIMQIIFRMYVCFNTYFSTGYFRFAPVFHPSVFIEAHSGSRSTPKWLWVVSIGTYGGTVWRPESTRRSGRIYALQRCHERRNWRIPPH